MKVLKKAEYGLRAMIHLAKNHNKKIISIREISNGEGIPFEFLGKIFLDLEKAKLVKARHGVNGGYSLARRPEKITVIDIVSLLENINAVNCAFCPKEKKCLTKNVWAKVDKAVNKALGSITLKDLIK